MMLKKFIENTMYIVLYIVALLLFFMCDGNTGNFWVLFASAHLLCIIGAFISSDKEITAFFLKSLVVYALVSNILVLSSYSDIWHILLFFALGLIHIFMLEDDDLFGVLAKDKKDHEMFGLKLVLWLMISVMVMVFYVFV